MTPEQSSAAPSAPLRPVSIAAAMWVGSIALIILAIQPILLGALVERGLIATDQLGQTATVEMFAIAVACAVSPQYLRRGALRWKVAAISLALAAVDVGSGLAHGATMIFALRGVAGLLEGFIFGATILMMLQGRHPERLNGIFLAVSAIPQALGALILPSVLLPAIGIAGCFDVLAGTALLSAAGASFIRLRTVPGAGAVQPPAAKIQWSASIALGLLGVFLQNAAIGAAWSFIERIASNRGFTANDVAVAACGTLVMQVVGAATVAWVGSRLPLRTTLVFGAIVQAALLAAIALGHSTGVYIGSAWVFGFLWLGLMAFSMRLLVEIDASRVSASWAVALNLLGQSAGPMLGTLGVRAGDVGGAFLIGSGLLGVCSVLYAIAASAKPVSPQLNSRVAIGLS